MSDKPTYERGDMTPEEFADGFALWLEHAPQSGEDWLTVARRFIGDDGDTSQSSPLFAGLVFAVREIAHLEAERAGLAETISVLTDTDAMSDLLATERELRAKAEAARAGLETALREREKLARDFCGRLHAIENTVRQATAIPAFNRNVIESLARRTMDEILTLARWDEEVAALGVVS